MMVTGGQSTYSEGESGERGIGTKGRVAESNERLQAPLLSINLIHV